MALVFAEITGGGWNTTPPVKVGSNRSYGKYRVYYDTIDFSVTPAAVGDDVVIGSLTPGATIWSGFHFWTEGTGMTATSEIELGVVDKKTGVYSAVSSTFDLTTADSRLGWNGVNAVDSVAAALPRGFADEAWLVVRISVVDATAGVLKAEVPVTVE